MQGHALEIKYIHISHANVYNTRAFVRWTLVNVGPEARAHVGPDFDSSSGERLREELYTS